MKTILIVLSLALTLFYTPFTLAEGDLSRANVITLNFEMGSDTEGMYFRPNKLNLVTGQAYKIVLTNTDVIKHEFESFEFIEKIFTRKVELVTEKGDFLAEIKGHITEIEVGPHTSVEWYFVPVQTGANIEVACALPGHKEAGMVGLINID
ncbi:biphenyl 2,3-dioxygenase [Psychromonas sp. MB-3u-54]|uniref:cupredoxin domain-containing protein n=1 Tax=Psychromonas sp. MB-3u-54 TaxID=2058319 RepID=UPI000C33DE94|nr:biphenyl 2,3-dioxygenase [Psychromonas sp. MB-3u-54]PKH04315.1 biphenyl 2,3-dioxygenase [Psychromonas sp. MB-3u-54]